MSSFELQTAMNVVKEGKVNVKNAYGLFPLHYCNNIEAANLYIKAGADVNARDSSGGTPLHYVRDLEVAEALIDAGADVNAENVNGFTPVHCQTCNKSIFSLLVQSKANLKPRISLIHSCAEKASKTVLYLLTRNGGDINEKDQYGCTVLHYADYYFTVEILGRLGANFKARDNEGSNPLHYPKDYESIRYLIDAGCDVNERNTHGVAPIDNPLVREAADEIAAENEKQRIRKLSQERIVRFMRNCKWLRLYKLTRTFKFNKWYCGEVDGNGGGVGRKVDHKRIMDTKFVR